MTHLVSVFNVDWMLLFVDYNTMTYVVMNVLAILVTFSFQLN